MKSKNISYVGESNNHQLRPELRNQPKFDKLVGPMYDGGGKVRYETQDVNDSLSI